MDPEAYTLRQEKGFAGFGKKTSGYHLTVEANLNQGNLCNMSSSLYIQQNPAHTITCCKSDQCYGV